MSDHDETLREGIDFEWPPDAANARIAGAVEALTAVTGADLKAAGDAYVAGLAKLVWIMRQQMVRAKGEQFVTETELTAADQLAEISA